MSPRMLSSHLMGGLPLLVIFSGFVNVNFMHGFMSSDLNRCPSHLNLPAFTTFTMSGSSYNWYNSWLYLIRYVPLSLVDP
jgi:hypothetical protein